MSQTLHDVRYACRVFRAHPALTAVAVLSLAVGIGPNSVLFSVIDGLGLRPLPIARPATLISMAFVAPNRMSDSLFERSNASYPDFVDLRDRSRSFAQLAAAAPMGVGVSGDSAPAEFAMGAVVSTSYFSTLGVTPALGRTFGPEEDRIAGSQAVAMISHTFWRRRFGADPAVVGRPIRLNTVACTIVGVLPAGFAGTQPLLATDVWVPTALAPSLTDASKGMLESRSRREFSLYARLRPGISLERAQAEMTALAAGLAEAFPATNKDLTIRIAFEQAARQARFSKIAVFALSVVGLVLLLACANVAGLLLGRADARRSEIAVRLALGASRGRLVRQLLTESALLSMLAAAAGLLLALWLLRAVPALIPPSPIAFNLDFRLDLRVFAFTLVVALAAAPLFGLVPALAASRPDVVPLLKGGAPGGGGRSSRLVLRNVLVVGQIAVSLGLLIASGLLVRSFLNMQRIDPGFVPRPMVLTTMAPGAVGYSRAQTADFYRRLLDRLAAVPGVERATMARHLPLNSLFGGGVTQEVDIPGYRPPAGETSLRVRYNTVERGYLETMGTRLLQGRDFAATDGPESAGVVMINQTMARRYWPDGNPVGRHLTLIGGTQPTAKRDCEVIGIVQDGKYLGLVEETPPYLYVLYAQQPAGEMTVIARVSGDAGPMRSILRLIVAEMDPAMPIMQVTTIEEHMRFALAGQRLVAWFVAALGGLGLLLSVVGLYGVVAFLVSRRTRDIGVRVALGATPGDVEREIIRLAGQLALVGIAIGAGLAALAMRVAGHGLHGVSPWDPATYAGASALVLVVALTAAYGPARRATRIDPITALRAE